MSATVPSGFLARVRRATPEQQEAIWRFLDAGVPLPGSGVAPAPDTGGVPTCPSMADCARRIVLGGHSRCGERGLACVVAVKGGGVSREEREGGEGGKGMSTSPACADLLITKCSLTEVGAA